MVIKKMILSKRVVAVVQYLELKFQDKRGTKNLKSIIAQSVLKNIKRERQILHVSH